MAGYDWIGTTCGWIPIGGVIVHWRLTGLNNVLRGNSDALWHDGQCVAEETYTLTDNMYFRNELRPRMLEQVGFKIEAIQSAYEDVEATVEDDVIVFIARIID